jgi:hypothetical protein
MRQWMIVGALCVVACAPAVSSIQGDVFLMMKSGDTKRGAGLTIYLLPDSAAMQAVDSGCASVKRAMAALGDSLESAYDSLEKASNAAQRALIADILSERKRAEWDKRTMAQMASLAKGAVARKRARSEAMSMMNSVIRRTATDSATTGLNAHYSFARVAAGTYIIFGSWSIAENDYAWWSELELSPGQNITRDLDNATERSRTLYCGLTEPEG